LCHHASRNESLEKLLCISKSLLPKARKRAPIDKLGTGLVVV
jgi:hypothetical protein